MVYVAFILSVIIAASASGADLAQTGDAQHRHRSRPVSEYNVEEMIRAEEDPDYGQYLKERERAKKEEKAAALEYERKRRAEEEAQYKAYRQYLKEKREKAARERSIKQKYVVDENKLWQQQQEKNRQEYIQHEARELQRHQAERTARIQRAMSVQRMPASEK